MLVLAASTDGDLRLSPRWIRELIDRWNSVVSPGDEDEVTSAICRQRQSVSPNGYGQKHLIVGNNDDPAVTECAG